MWYAYDPGRDHAFRRFVAGPLDTMAAGCYCGWVSACYYRQELAFDHYEEHRRRNLLVRRVLGGEVPDAVVA